MKLNNDHKDLFLSFLRIGAFTFGGGYAMIPLIHKEAVEKYQWINDEDILDILAIAESTPGVLAVNTATFVGYKVGGFWGSLLATAGVALPSFAVILLISLFYTAFRENVWVNYAFMGIRAGVTVLLLNACLKLSKALKKNVFSLVLMGAAFFLTVLFDLSAIWIVLLAALCGILYHLFLEKWGGDKA